VAVVMNQLALERVSLELDLANGLEPVHADGNQIQQVVVNLLINAADAIGDGGGTITVGTRAASAAGAELFVEDSGKGIPPEHLDRLFEPFFTTKGPRGTGLGLAVTWGIVEAHGGTIDVRSEPGQGSRFTVRLPCREESLAPATEPRAARDTNPIAMPAKASGAPALGSAGGGAS
jgi:two-component system NtrC family sensor kinase